MTYETDYAYYNDCPDHVYGCPGGSPCNKDTDEAPTDA